MPGYSIHTELRFTVCGEEFAVVDHDDKSIEIEETRKNGQEDAHMCGTLVKRDGIWVWEDEWSRDRFVMYGNDGVADAIPAYINANPLPRV